MSSCYFIGPRKAPISLQQQLDKAVEQHIVQWGVTDFVIGDEGDFDAMATRSVWDAKQRHPMVTLHKLSSNYGYETNTSDHTRTDARNAKMVHVRSKIIDNCDYLIIFIRYSDVDLWDLEVYAKIRAKNGLVVITSLNTPK